MGPAIGESQTWIRGDVHVHLHPVFDRGHFLAGALSLAESLGSPLLLCLTEVQGVDAFGALRGVAEAGGALPEADDLIVVRTQEEASVGIGRRGTRASVFCLAGQQRVSSEGIEVLAIGAPTASGAGIASLDDRAHSAETLLRRALDAGCIAGLPWGVGKWLGARGRGVARLVGHAELAGRPRFFLGDIAARCWPWPRPRVFAAGPRVLAGSDLLPLPGKEAGLASYRFALRAPFDAERPATCLLAALGDASTSVRCEGRREYLWETVARQLEYRRRGGGALLAAEGGNVGESA